jgi:hypothetical protein
MAVLPAYMQPNIVAKISIHVYTCTAILLFCAMILQAYIMLLCMRDVCNSE